MHLIQQPQQELLSVVLLIALVLRPVLLQPLLKTGTQFRTILTGPQGLQKHRQLFRYFTFGAELLRVQLVPSGQIGFVLVKDKVLGQYIGVRYALEHCVDEARIALVFQAGNAGRILGAPRLKSHRRHSVVIEVLVDARNATYVLGDFVDYFLDRRAAVTN